MLPWRSETGKESEGERVWTRITNGPILTSFIEFLRQRKANKTKHGVDDDDDDGEMLKSFVARASFI